MPALWWRPTTRHTPPTRRQHAAVRSFIPPCDWWAALRRWDILPGRWSARQTYEHINNCQTFICAHMDGEPETYETHTHTHTDTQHSSSPSLGVAGTSLTVPVLPLYDVTYQWGKEHRTQMPSWGIWGGRWGGKQEDKWLVVPTDSALCVCVCVCGVTLNP